MEVKSLIQLYSVDVELMLRKVKLQTIAEYILGNKGVVFRN